MQGFENAFHSFRAKGSFLPSTKSLTSFCSLLIRLAGETIEHVLDVHIAGDEVRSLA
jgi:hypothetical protein